MQFLRLRLIITVFLVVLAAFLILLPSVSIGAAATLGLSPAKGSLTEGESITVKLTVSTGQAINAAEGTLSFPKDLLEAKSVSRSGSVFTLWASEPKASNAAGTVSFSGGLPSPGYKGSGGKIFSVTFLAKKIGTATLSLSGAQVLANDGLGTNILSGTGSATFTVKAKETQPEQPAQPIGTPQPTIASTTNPDQNAWYKSSEVAASWSAGSGVLGYNAVFDQSALTDPPQVSEGLEHAFRRSALADGVWYLHVRAQYQSGWSATRHFRFQIDTTPPEQFSLTISQTDPQAREANVTFETTDKTSGIDHYGLQLDSGELQTVTSPAALTDLSPGDHTVIVRAYDKAGNVTEASAVVKVASGGVPTPTEYALEVEAVTPSGQAFQAIESGQHIVLRGYAKLTDTIHIVVRSTESVFDFPVKDIVDPAPIQPAPAGMTAWKVEISPDLGPGDHEIRVTAVDANGQTTAAAPVIRFRVVTNVVRVGSALVPYRTVVLVLLVISIVLLVSLVAILVLYLRLRSSGNQIRKRKGVVRDVRSPRS